MGARADAARAEVLAARGAAESEIEQLEASARAAVDIRAKIRRNPGRTAGVAAGAGFLAIGGPRRVVRRVRTAVLGPSEPLPKSMLPKEIDQRLRKLGPDGERARVVLEREFATYLEESEPKRRERDLSAVIALALSSFARPVALRVGRELVNQLFSPDRPGFQEQLERIRARRPTDPAPADPTVAGAPRSDPPRA
ncbi:MAG: hypothetical protein ACJ77N_08170 [Chloroflexota bacterium]|jgi:hypothetical protein